MYRRLCLIAVLAIALVPLAAGPVAADTQNVPCTVTIAEPIIAITLDYPYGTPDFPGMKLGEYADWNTPLTLEWKYVNIVNSGNVPEYVYVSGADAHSVEVTGTWTLKEDVGDTGTNEYRVNVFHPEFPDQMTILSKSLQVFTTLATTGNDHLSMRVYSPHATTFYGTYNFDVVLTAAAL